MLVQNWNMKGSKQSGAVLQPSADDRVLKTRVGCLWFGSDGIMRGTSEPGSDLTLEDVLEIQQKSRELVGQRKLPSLVDITNVRSITPEARRAWGNPAVSGRTVALAMVVRSPVSRVLGNIFLGLKRASFPVKLFSSADEALVWLRRFTEPAEQ